MVSANQLNYAKTQLGNYNVWSDTSVTETETNRVKYDIQNQGFWHKFIVLINCCRL